ncbi:MAG: DUF4838 domain-containing protein, partial [Opitutales bacterium]
PLGREVEARAVLRLPFGDHAAHPSYFSRDLGGLDRPEERAWYRANRLFALFEHGHTASRIFTPAILAVQPEMAPLLRGRRYLPTDPRDGNWQPDFTNAAAATLAAGQAKAAFQAVPERVSFAIGENDTFRFDQSPATLAAVAPAQYFRGRPDYANVLFGFLNRVAAEVARDYPDRFITSYAYYWTENAPRFQVEPNILPFLTADRSDWFDPDFADADRALIRRWRNSGPRLLGLYDYYYGAPFFVPRPTLYAVSGPIPYAYEMGARAFYAESSPNWGLDGPKCWLAAQLLWDARADPAALIDEYYRKFWREAAGPMREYFELCDRQWLNQPKPAVWIKYYRDDHQRLLFPPEVRLELRARLERAAALARQPVVRHRLRLCQAAFNLAEEFCRHDELREELQRLATNPRADTPALVGAWNRYSAARMNLRLQLAETQRDFPLAVKSALHGDYLRNDPRRRVVWDLAQRDFDLARFNETGMRSLFSGRRTSLAELHVPTVELAADPGLATLRRRAGHEFTLIEWAEPGSPWIGRGEPHETRRIELLPRADGSQAIRYSGCNIESLYQWVASQPGALYLGSVKVRARISPGNSTFLIVSFLDHEGRYVGPGLIDRLPVGEWGGGTELKVLVRAPRAAASIAVGVRTLSQVNDDFAEFEHLSLRRLE